MSIINQARGYSSGGEMITRVLVEKLERDIWYCTLSVDQVRDSSSGGEMRTSGREENKKQAMDDK
jgi:hypothetical protein